MSMNLLKHINLYRCERLPTFQNTYGPLRHKSINGLSLRHLRISFFLTFLSGVKRLLSVTSSMFSNIAGTALCKEHCLFMFYARRQITFFGKVFCIAQESDAELLIIYFLSTFDFTHTLSLTLSECWIILKEIKDKVSWEKLVTSINPGVNVNQVWCLPN